LVPFGRNNEKFLIFFLNSFRMRSLCQIILFSALVDWACQTSAPPPRPVKYLPENIDTVMLDPDANRIKVCTWRHYQKLCDALLATFGTPLPNDPSNGYGSYSIHYYCWAPSGRFGMDDASLECMVSKDMDEYIFIQLYFVGNNGKWRPLTQEFKDFFQKSCRENLFDQPVVMHPMHHSIPRFNQLSEVLHYDSLTLHRALDAFFDPYALRSSIEFYINKAGQIDSIQIDAGVKAKPCLREWANTLQFPLLIYDTSGDTTAYRVHWEDHADLDHYPERIQQLLLSHKMPPDSSPYALSFTGDFFHTGDTFAIIPRWDSSFFYSYRIRSGAFIPVYPCPLKDAMGESLTFEDMDFDGIPEMILGSLPNMNGNSGFHIYRWNAPADRLELAGSLFGGVEKQPAIKEIWEIQEGSRYADRVKTVFGWSKGRLIPKRQMRREQQLKDMDCTEVLVKFLRNPFFDRGMDSLVLRATREERLCRPRYDKVWEDYFRQSPY